jgi:hypothetical protein
VEDLSLTSYHRSTTKIYGLHIANSLAIVGAPPYVLYVIIVWYGSTNKDINKYVFSLAFQPKLGLSHLLLRFPNHTGSDTHTPGRIPLSEQLVCHRGRYLHDTQQKQETTYPHPQMDLNL